MRGKEEIQKAIEEEFEDHLFEDESDYIMQLSKFKKGIKWADQHPREGLWDAEKVIEWLKSNIHEYYMVNEFSEEFDLMYEDLKKAMEE